MDFFWSLRRSRANSRIGGVCGALAARWNTDPLLVRIIAVLVALSGGVGLVLYAACWLLLPREGEAHSPLERRFPGAASWSRQTWLVIVVIACALSFAVLSSTLSVGILPTAIVVGVIWWGRRGKPLDVDARTTRPDATAFAPEDRRPHDPHVAPDTAATQPSGYTPLRDPFRGADTPFTQSARAWQHRVRQATETADVRAEPGGEPMQRPSNVTPRPATTSAIKAYLTEPDPVGLYGPAATVTEKRRFSRAVPLTAAVLAAAMLGLFIAQLAGLAVSTPLYWGVALLILGLSCVVNAWRSQAGLRGGRWLAIAAIVASLLAVGANFPSARPATPDTATTLSFSTPQALPATLEVPSGEAIIDLSQLTLSRDQTVSMQMKLGSLDVRLPETGRVRVIATTKAGGLEVLDRESAGLDNLSLDVTDGQGQATLTLNLNVDYGVVEVQR